MHVRRARPQDRPLVVATVVAAFGADPAWRFFVGPGSGADYASSASALAGFFFDKRVTAGTVWMTGGAEAVALWDAPAGASQPAAPGGPAGAERERSLRAAVGEQVWDRLARYDEAVAAVRPRGPLWYLGVLATRPDCQGRGLAGQVLAPALAEADAQRLPCGLETSTQANCRYYRRYGFAVTAQARLAEGPATWWLQRGTHPG